MRIVRLRAASAQTHRRELWLLALFTLAAFALRLIDLTARVMWIDESFTLLRVLGGWSGLISNFIERQGIATTDLNPPLYFALLKAFITLGGDSEFVLRLFSAMCAVLIVPLTYVLARRAFNWRVGLIAALLALLCPAYQWYGWEIRMYAMAACMAALSAYVLWRAVGHDRIAIGWLVAWIFTAVLSLFTHYTFVGFVLAQIVFIVYRWLTQLRHVINADAIRVSSRGWLVVLGVLSMLIAVVAFTRASNTMQQVVGMWAPFLSTPVGQPVPLWSVIAEVLGAMTFGMNAADPMGGWINLVVGVMCALGVILPLSRAQLQSRVMLALLVIVPIAFWLALSYFIPNRPSFRYLIVIAPMLHVLIAHAADYLVTIRITGSDIGFLQEIRYLWSNSGGLLIAHMRQAMKSTRGDLLRWLVVGSGAVALAVVIFGQIYGMAQTFDRTPTWQDDWRALASYVRDHWQPGDGLLVNLYTPEAVLPVYLRGLPIDLLPLHKIKIDKMAIKTPQDLARSYPRIWFTNIGGRDFESGSAAGWLTNLYTRERRTFPARTNTLELALIESHSPLTDRLPDGATAVKDSGSRASPIFLAGYEIKPGNPYNQSSNMRLSLYWGRTQSAGPAAAAYNVPYALSLRLMDAGQTWWDWSFPARLDAAPADWLPGAYFRVDHIIPLPLGLPNQPYQLELHVRMGDKGDVIQDAMQRITPEQLMCCVRITSWPGQNTAADSAAQSRIRDIWQTSDAALTSAEFPNVIHPGQTLPIALTWRKTRDDASGWQTRLSLDGLLGGSLASEQSPVGSEAFPVAAWPSNEPVRNIHSLQLPYTARPGWYRLSLDRYHNGQRLDGTLLGLVEVRDYLPTPVPTDVKHPVNARVGEISLLGYGLQGVADVIRIERGITYDIHTYWRVDAAPTRDGVLFLHVIGPDGKLVSQDDNPPERGARATLTYRPGSGIDQVHRITIPAEALPGEYQLYVGIYDREGALRWPAQQDGQPAKDELVRAGSFTLP